MTTRPYFIIYEGKPRMVEATSPAVAVHHVVGAAITEIRPARGAEVSAWLRGGKEMEIAGQKPADGRQQELGEASQEFDGTDARVWLIERTPPVQEGSVCEPLAVFDRIRAQDHMTLDDFEEMRSLSAEFVCAVIGHDMNSDQPYNLAEISNELKDAPMPFDHVVRLIGEAKRRELFEDVATETAERGTNGETRKAE